jgi:hypothetical protein
MMVRQLRFAESTGDALRVLTIAFFLFGYLPVSIAKSGADSNNSDIRELILYSLWLALFVYWTLWMIRRKDTTIIQQILALGLVLWWTISTVAAESASLGDMVLLLLFLFAATFPLPRFRRP